MSAEAALTRHNPQLQGPTKAPHSAPRVEHGEAYLIAINCTDIRSRVEAYIERGIAPATRVAYHSDLQHFTSWGGSIPSSDEEVATYLAVHAESLAPATLSRRLVAVGVAHTARGLPSPTGSPLVRATLRGIRRERGTAQKQAKPLLREDLFAVLSVMGTSMKDRRDRALLLLGFAGAFRRSELTGLDVEDIERVQQGLIITLRRSKTDQEGQGRKIGIPRGRTRWCPVAALEEWLSASRIDSGPIFRPVNRHGQLSPARLSGEAVCSVVRDRLEGAGYNPSRYSGHSLRAGFATSAAQAGVSSMKIRAQTGHVSDSMLLRYIRDGELFIGNAAGAVL